VKSGCYKEVQTYTDHILEDAMIEYCQAAVQVGEALEDSKLKAALVSSRNAKQDLWSNLQVTVKTHKPPGKVTLRALHASPSSPFSPGMKLIGSLLREELKKLPHLLVDSRDLLQKLGAFRVPSCARFVRFDIKEFFMSGQHADLANKGTMLLAGPRNEFRELVRSIISNQLIRIPGINRGWRVTIGSGMGLSFSGELSDAVFYELCEKDFACSREVQKYYGVIHYSRFKDDGLIIFDGAIPAIEEDFIKGITDRAAYFSVEFDPPEMKSVVMLDVEIFKGPRWESIRYLDHRAFVKPSSQWVPLRPDSNHHDGIHASWPKSRVKVLMGLCNSKADAKDARQWFLQKMESAGVAVNLTPTKSLQRKSSSVIGPPVRLVLPYRPEWHLASVPSLLKRIHNRWSSRLNSVNSQVNFATTVAWRLGGMHLVHRLRSLSLAQHEKHAEYKVVNLSEDGGRGRWWPR